jgi:hypothetical protein
MRKVIAAVLLVACGTLSPALAHDPRTTAKDFSHGLKIEGAGELSFIYKAMHFNEPTYKRMQSEATFRERMNTNVWSSIGSVNAEFDVVMGDQTIPKGKYTLGLSIEPGDAFLLVLKGGDKTLKVPLKMTSETMDVPYLTFSIYPTEKPDIFVVEGRCGKFRGTADFKVPYLDEHSHPASKK